jgi:hypothetical protein
MHHCFDATEADTDFNNCLALSRFPGSLTPVVPTPAHTYHVCRSADRVLRAHATCPELPVAMCIPETTSRNPRLPNHIMYKYQPGALGEDGANLRAVDFLVT